MNALKVLKYPPIKSSIQKKLPEHLVYGFPANIPGYMLKDTFVLFKTKQPDKRCYMRCYPDIIHRNDKNKPVSSLYIYSLYSTPIKNGLGTKMLDFAQAFSKKNGCNGYFHLSANSGFMPNAVPHIFYGKYGMNSESKVVNKNINYFINKGWNATYNDLPNINMYYPPIKFISWQEKIKNFFTSLVK